MFYRLPWLPLLALLLLPAPAAATIRVWPGAAPCAGTLQACINGAADHDVIQIATSTPIVEDVEFGHHSLTLTAADGYAPSFGPGHSLYLDNNAAGDTEVSISHLTFTDGNVRGIYTGTGTAILDLRDLTLTRASSNEANSIWVSAYAGSTVEATLYNNRLTGVPPNYFGMLALDARGGTIKGDLLYNHVTSTSAAVVEGAGIFVGAGENFAGTVAGTGTFKLLGNEVRGGFSVGGISVQEYLGALANNITASLYSNVTICGDLQDLGIFEEVNHGSINTQIVNNTVSRCSIGIEAVRYQPYTGTISGDVRNNLVVANFGLAFTPYATDSLSEDYDLLDAPAPVLVGGGPAVLGAHTILGSAQLVLDTQPRLRPGSPAIDAADTFTLGSGLLLHGLPALDADGLRRFKGASGKADIGAYEFGDVTLTHVATAATIGGNTSTIDSAALNGNAGAALIAVPNYNIGNESAGVDYDNSFGAYYTAAHWALFNQVSATAMPLGAHFDVFVPAAGVGSFVHNATALNSGGSATTLQDASTDNLPDQIVLATQNWTAGGSGHYNAFPIGVLYGGDSLWHVVNLTDAYMDLPLGFNIYTQEASPNALRVTASAGNLGFRGLRLDHPLLDGTPCARLLATRLRGASTVPGNFDVAYALGKWYIHGYSGIASGDQFHVVIDPAQVFECRDRIFANAFN